MSEFAQYYYFVYWFIVMLMTMNKFNLVQKIKGYGVVQQEDNYGPFFLFFVFYILFYGFRPIDGLYFGDTANYAKTYELLQQYGVFNMQGDDEVSHDWLFYTIQVICSSVMNVHFFFTICVFLYIVPMYSGCKRLDIRHGATLMLFCVGAFEFYSFSVNGVRNGIACNILILAIAFLCQKKWIPVLLFAFAATGFHKSAALPVAAMFFSYFVRKPKLMYITWLGAIVISLAVGNYIDNMLSLMSYDDRLATNLQADDADGQILEHRFRWDFLLYSFMPILLSWYTIFKRNLYNSTYLILLGTYIYANSFWVLAIRAMFSNRIAYLSWFIYPIVLAYPLLNFPVFKKNHSQKTAWILLGHFGFTTLLWLLGM